MMSGKVGADEVLGGVIDGAADGNCDGVTESAEALSAEFGFDINQSFSKMNCVIN